jgi:hypothetical protein
VFSTEGDIQVEIVATLCVRLAVQEQNFYFCLYHLLTPYDKRDNNAEVECKLQHRVDM